jgi:hypothetical protein
MPERGCVGGDQPQHHRIPQTFRARHVLRLVFDTAALQFQNSL